MYLYLAQYYFLFIEGDKPIGASPRRDYVGSEEDGISKNNLVLLLYHGVGNE